MVARRKSQVRLEGHYVDAVDPILTRLGISRSAFLNSCLRAFYRYLQDVGCPGPDSDFDELDKLYTDFLDRMRGRA